MIDYEKHLNAEQLAVVMEERGPILVLAGAGSGKTRALTYRVARLVESGVRPENILLATFTNKAAKSMLSRVRELLDTNLERLWGGTFHHLCHLILRAHARTAGLGPNFSIIDNEDAKSLLHTCLAENKNFPVGDRMPRAPVILEIINLARKLNQGLGQLIETKYGYLSILTEEICEIAELYRQKKQRLNVVDFEDLIEKTRQMLLDFPHLAEYYGQRFHHILVDEYQDTDLLQAQIVDILAARHRNLMVVGDDAQSIYAFRGANYANIIAFPKRYPDCRIFKLETNYRSTQEILTLANICIEKNENQLKKNLHAARGEGLLPVVVAARDVSQQADFVAQRIIEFARGGLALDNIAVLYRAHFHSMELQMELARRGIPFAVRSGIRFFEQAHVKDVVAFLRIFANPQDEMAWRRILTMYAHIGPKTADKLWRILAKQASPLDFSLTDAFMASAPKSAQAGLTRLQQMLADVLPDADTAAPSELVNRVINQGYRGLLQDRFPDPESREEDLRQLADFSRRYLDLHTLLGELALLTSADENEGDEGIKSEAKERVILSTIHQAKGLEWSCVILIWCADGMLPYSRSLKEPGGEEEERRLFYVAVTRAKDHLYLVYPVMNYGRQTGYLLNSPSRFISELTGLFPHSRPIPYERWELEG